MVIGDCFDILVNYGCSLTRTLCVGVDNFLTYFNYKKPRFGPLYVGWDITFRCNLHCDSCQTHRFITQDKELNTEECMGIIKQLGKAKISVVSLTGGEPLLRDDIFILLKALKKENISVNLNTNGVILEHHVNDIINSSLSVLSVTILNNTNEDSADKNHSIIQGEVIKKIILRRRKKRPRIIAAFTLTRKNMSSINDLINYWQEKADQILLQPVHHSKTSIFRCSGSAHFFPKESSAAFRQTFNSLLEEHAQLQTAYVREFPDFFFNRDVLKKKYRCFAGSFMLQIDAYGNVYPCPEFVEKLGSLRKEDFQEIMNNQRTKNFRELVRNKRNECFCWYRCTGQINYYMKKLLSPAFNKTKR